MTGASSGIGLVTARLAARRGARLVLAARSGDELQRLAEEIKTHRGEAVPVAADVSNQEDVEHIAKTHMHHFGGFDTWVNNAGVTVFGRLQEIAMEDHRRLTVYGSLAAVRHLRQRGGALINIGSVAPAAAAGGLGRSSATRGPRWNCGPERTAAVLPAVSYRDVGRSVSSREPSSQQKAPCCCLRAA